MSNTEGLLRMHLKNARDNNCKLHAVMRHYKLQIKQIIDKMDKMLNIKTDKFR